MPVATYNPGCSVTIQKMVARRGDQAQRYPSGSLGPGPGPLIDITPYLGEEGRVFVSKSIYQAMGAFSIVCADRPDNRYLDTLYGFIEPMDYVEIRMSRWPHRYMGQRLPIIMRGFVQSITRQELMSADGKPRRYVVISGRDFGVLFNHIRILKLQAYAESINLLTGFNFWAQTGIKAQLYSPPEWIAAVLTKIINPHLDALFQVAGGPMQAPQIVPAVTVTEGTVWPNKDYPDGTIWELLNKHADLNWNELFVRDTEATVELVHRPIPWRSTTDPQGDWIPQGAQTVALPASEIIDVDIDAVVSLVANRSDTHVANLFWVDYIEGALVGSSPLLQAYASQLAHQGTIYLDNPRDYPNVNPALYGTRPMHTRVEMLFDRAQGAPISLPAARQAQAARDMVSWITQKREDLIALNKDNVVLEDGSMVLRGHEDIRPGRYVRLTRHKLTAWYYAFSVIHQYQPYQRYTTTVQYVRGTGFLERSRRDKPYLDEGKKGVYP